MMKGRVGENRIQLDYCSLKRTASASFFGTQRSKFPTMIRKIIQDLGVRMAHNLKNSHHFNN